LLPGLNSKKRYRVSTILKRTNILIIVKKRYIFLDLGTKKALKIHKDFREI